MSLLTLFNHDSNALPSSHALFSPTLFTLTSAINQQHGLTEVLNTNDTTTDPLTVYSNSTVDELNETVVSHSMLHDLHSASRNPSVCIDSYIHSSGCREIGDSGVWHLSSAKHGNGVNELRDNDLDTYWQSDGVAPHTITITFHRRQPVRCIGLYVDYKKDESYTPAKISIRTSQFHSTNTLATVSNGNINPAMYSQLMAATTNLQSHGSVERQLIELEEPTGWITIFLDSQALLNDVQNDNTDDDDFFGSSMNGGDASGNDRVCSVEIVVLSSHQNGRDTHIRQCKIFAPMTVATKGHNTDLTTFTSAEFEQFATIR